MKVGMTAETTMTSATERKHDPRLVDLSFTRRWFISGIKAVHNMVAVIGALAFLSMLALPSRTYENQLHLPSLCPSTVARC